MAFPRGVDDTIHLQESECRHGRLAGHLAGARSHECDGDRALLAAEALDLIAQQELNLLKAPQWAP